MSFVVNSKLFGAAIVGGFLAVSAASAGTVNMTYQTAGNVFGAPNLSQTVRVASPSLNQRVSAGPFRLTGDHGFGDFVGFCIDLPQKMRNHTDYTVSGASMYGATVDGRIDRLFTSAYGGVDTAVEGAAFQLALWEIITDHGPVPSLISGYFRAAASNAVMSQAAAYLHGIAGAATGGYRLSYLASGTSQDLVGVSPVPVPAAFGMLGLGLAGLFGLKRRKKA